MIPGKPRPLDRVERLFAYWMRFNRHHSIIHGLDKVSCVLQESLVGGFRARGNRNMTSDPLSFECRELFYKRVSVQYENGKASY